MMVDGEYRSSIIANGPFGTDFRTNPFAEGYYKLLTKNSNVIYYLQPEDLSAVACVFGSIIALPEKVRAIKTDGNYIESEDNEVSEEFVVKQLYVLGSINSELEIPTTIEDVYVDRLPYLMNNSNWNTNHHPDLKFSIFPDENTPLMATAEGSLYTQGQERLLYLQTSAYNEDSVVCLPDEVNEIDNFAIMNLKCKELHVPSGVDLFPLSKSIAAIIYFDNRLEDVKIVCPETGHVYTKLEKQMCPMLRFVAPEYRESFSLRGHFLTLTKAPQPGDSQWRWASEVKINANHIEAITPWLLDCTNEYQGTRILMSHQVIDVYEDIEQVTSMLVAHDRKNKE